MAVEVRVVGPDALPACHAIRHEVFVRGQGVPADLERDGRDAEAVHVLATVDGVPVGTARMRVDHGRPKVERVAVLARSRGLGLGHAIMDVLEAAARRAGHQEVHLHAQEDVIGFYAARGYEPEGDRFVEAGIVHLAMTLSWPAP